ncbi:conserved hypothetical protein [Hahella chejuensis KCTC 2396]|uniref:Uncharacterized protein n=1 Tax=Hahella chejuensis (strain KCTC 2396) TaxID=349521 RepID=Q2SAB5_HAHCH|nr:WYL domain-containing protein [Hahella chejuensis]ABC32409.1 conserved hypothetical protein [Hahella chejuensis KCTC 2396]
MRTFLRRLSILAYLKSARAPKSTEEIINHLISADYMEEGGDPNSQKRLIQRDMNFLYGKNEMEDEDDEPGNEFGLEVVRGVGKSLLWKLDPYSTLQYDYEKMPQYMAIAFAMAKKHLSNLLPRNTISELERFFAQAEERLEQSEKSLSPQLYNRLRDSVEFYQRGQRLQPADFDIEHLDTIYRAILKNKQVLFTYRGKEYRAHPFGVAILLPKIYLVAKKDEDIDTPGAYRHFLLHKIERITMDQRSSRVPKKFRLRDYLEAGKMDVFIDPEDNSVYSMKLRITPANPYSNLISDLSENPIAVDQKIKPATDESGSYILTAKVRRTIQLRNWLMNLGAECNVMEPQEIRDDLISALRDTLSNYGA